MTRLSRRLYINFLSNMLNQTWPFRCWQLDGVQRCRVKMTLNLRVFWSNVWNYVFNTGSGDVLNGTFTWYMYRPRPAIDQTSAFRNIYVLLTAYCQIIYATVFLCLKDWHEGSNKFRHVTCCLWEYACYVKRIDFTIENIVMHHVKGTW